jgi:hypothetical protein
MLREKASSSLIEVKRNEKLTCFQDDSVHKGTCVHNVLQGGLVWRCGYWYEQGMGVPEEKRIVTFVWLGNQREYQQILYNLQLILTYVR